MSALLISTVILKCVGLVLRTDAQEVIVYYTETSRQVRVPVTDRQLLLMQCNRECPAVPSNSK